MHTCVVHVHSWWTDAPYAACALRPAQGSFSPEPSKMSDVPPQFRFHKGYTQFPKTRGSTFKYSVLSALYGKDHYRKSIVALNLHENKHILPDNPILSEEFAEIENLNRITINVFKFEEGKLVPHILTTGDYRFKHVNLFLSANGRYCAIYNLSAFV